MNVKSLALRMLEDNCGAYISGGALADELSVSRNAVWKAIESLRGSGYRITAIKGRGYCLEEVGDLLTEAGITGRLTHSGVFSVEVRESVTSTNAVMREMAAAGAREGCVLAAGEQTAGRGRQGRSFHSPAGRGAYFSVLLRPECAAVDAALITPAAAVAAAKAIRDIFSVDVGIKWVNDLFLDNRKVCGILTEASLGMENGLIDSAVLGIGVNITAPVNGFPEELAGTARALTDRSAGTNSERCRLIASTLDCFWDYYQRLQAREFLEEYRSLSVVTGRDIYVISGGGEKPARALSIDDDCGLVVEYENGDAGVLRSGEVSVRVG